MERRPNARQFLLHSLGSAILHDTYRISSQARIVLVVDIWSAWDTPSLVLFAILPLRRHPDLTPRETKFLGASSATALCYPLASPSKGPRRLSANGAHTKAYDARVKAKETFTPD